MGLKNDSLFLGLTRQPMIFGVTYNYVFLNMFGSLMYFIVTSDFKVVVVSLAMHGISYLPGFVGLNNLKCTDYINVVLHVRIDILKFLN